MRNGLNGGRKGHCRNTLQANKKGYIDLMHPLICSEGEELTLARPQAQQTRLRLRPAGLLVVLAKADHIAGARDRFHG